jgi:excisionase family DNA binding protein
MLGLTRLPGRNGSRRDAVRGYDRRVVTDPLTYSVQDAAGLLGMSRSRAYVEMGEGRLHFVKRGRYRRIPAADLHAYLELLRAEAAAARRVGRPS